MNGWFHRAAAVVLIQMLALPGGLLAAGPSAASAEEDARIVHALNRLGYGPRPGDVEKVRALGLEKWIQLQLHPERIDDHALQARLAGYRTLGLSAADLIAGYEVPREVKREIQKKRAEMGEDASEEDMARARREFLRENAGSLQQMQGRPREVVEELQAAKVMRAVYSERQLDEVMVDFWMNHFNVFAGKGQEKFLVGAYERDVIRPHAWGKFEDLLKATAESPAMLFYLDNWLSADPNAAPARMTMARGAGFGRRGRFGALGGRRPQDTPAQARPGQGQGQGQGRKRGLNENYAREVMELHTLGVDGGYTQQDVTEVARCFTGWTIRGLRQGHPEFVFDDRIHDGKDKRVLGQAIKGGGRGEGEKVLHLLATHPSTARFISTKLARRFVADDPPAAVVDRAAATFRKTGGDIRAVVAAIVTSPEFLAAPTRAVKVKTPLEFVASAARASGADVSDARDLARRIGEMGMPLYMQQPPTGYKDTSEAWVSTSGLLARLNLALDLAAGRIRGTALSPAALAPGAADAETTAAALSARLVPAGLSESTRRTLEGESGLDTARVAGLILGSPEFQRR
jgi:uncharacterized protein (DUF1800 family)